MPPARASFATLVLTVMLAALSACSGEDAAVPRPPSVPPSARLVSSETAYGAPSAATTTPRDQQDLFTSTSCADGVLVITTTKETVYAELPCDRAAPTAAAARFVDKAVKVRIVPGAQNKLYVESAAGGTLEFTPGHVWVETP